MLKPSLCTALTTWSENCAFCMQSSNAIFMHNKMAAWPKLLHEMDKFEHKEKTWFIEVAREELIFTIRRLSMSANFIDIRHTVKNQLLFNYSFLYSYRSKYFDIYISIYLYAYKFRYLYIYISIHLCIYESIYLYI